jgi:hypothetical protein
MLINKIYFFNNKQMTLISIRSCKLSLAKLSKKLDFTNFLQKNLYSAKQVFKKLVTFE